MTLEKAAQLHLLYADLYQKGQISDKTYRAVITGTALAVNGISDVTLEVITADIRTMKQILKSMNNILKKNE